MAVSGLLLVEGGEGRGGAGGEVTRGGMGWVKIGTTPVERLGLTFQHHKPYTDIIAEVVRSAAVIYMRRSSSLSDLLLLAD